jgi:dTDP-4-dehydrorhamnose 3,5-epimerase
MISYQPESRLLIKKNIYQTPLSGLYYLSHTIFPDDRGYFTQLSEIPDLESVTQVNFSVAQINLATSNTNVVRGFHAENWHKLVHVLSGAAYCALADVRPDSTTFGQVVNFTLSMDKSKGLPGSLFISPGIANSICVLEGPVNYLYHVNALYKDRNPADDIAISVFDPDLHVSWPIPKKDMILSERDLSAITLRKKFPEKFK